MPVGTPFHERTFALSASLNFREWAGYYAAGAYETHHEHEYNAIRNGAALIDDDTPTPPHALFTSAPSSTAMRSTTAP